MRPTSVPDSVRPRLATQYQSTSQSSSNQSANQKWKLYSLLAALGVTIAGLTYYMYRRRTQSTSESSKSSSRQSNAALSALQHKRDQILAAIESMTSSGEVISDISPWRSELTELITQSSKSVDSSVTPLSVLQAEYALDIVKLFATYHTLRNLMVAHAYDPSNPESVQSLTKWEAEQSEDLTQALTILESINQAALSAGFEQSSAEPADAASPAQPPVHPYTATHLLALELSQRLKDMGKLSATFQALANNPNVVTPSDRSDDELLALFMTAPMLGKWSDFKAFGEELQRRNGPDIMENFHAHAIEQSIYPDYKLLNDHAAQFEDILKKQTNPTPLMWSKFDVTELILSHDRSYSPNPMLNEQLQMLASQGKEPKLLRPEINTMPFQVTGSIVRMQSPYIVELPCVGLFTDSRFWMYSTAKVRGDPTTGEQGAEAPASMCEIEIVCKKESSLQQGKERSYTGSFIVRDFALDSHNNKGPMSVEHVFSLEMTIRQSD